MTTRVYPPCSPIDEIFLTTKAERARVKRCDSEPSFEHMVNFRGKDNQVLKFEVFNRLAGCCAFSLASHRDARSSKRVLAD